MVVHRSLRWFINLHLRKGGHMRFLIKKLENLAQVIKMLNNGHGPDLLGICEVQNQQITQKLLDKIGRDDYEIA